MDEQQIIQLLNQIPLEILQNYVSQRMQQEQAAAQQQYGQEAYAQGAADGMAAQQQYDYAPEQQVQAMAAGGYIPIGWDPYLDAYRVPRGSVPSLNMRKHKRRRA